LPHFEISKYGLEIWPTPKILKFCFFETRGFLIFVFFLATAQITLEGDFDAIEEMDSWLTQCSAALPEELNCIEVSKMNEFIVVTVEGPKQQIYGQFSSTTMINGYPVISYTILTRDCAECNMEFSTSGCSFALMVLTGQITMSFLPIPFGCEACDAQAMIDSCGRKYFSYSKFC
jgi:hypothetical protein